MRAEKLLNSLVTDIIPHIMIPENVVHFYQDGIEFENKKLQQMCETMIVKNFEVCFKQSKEFILTLPLSNFINLLKNDSLMIGQEYDLVDLVREFFIRRENAPFSLPPAQTIKPEIWNLISKAEQDARTSAFNAEVLKKVNA